MAQVQFGEILRFIHRACASHGACEQTDCELVERFLAHEEAAFASLVQRHGAMVLGVCRRTIADTHAAEDSFQATFMVLARRAASIRKKTSVTSWLYGVAQRIALKARGRSKSRLGAERRYVNMSRSEPFDELTWQELRTVLDEEIGRLPEKYQAPILLCYFEGKSHNQAAKQLGWPKNSVTNRLTRARELLRRQLERRGIGLAVGALATALADMAAAAPMPALLTIKTVKAAAVVVAGKAVAGGYLSARALALAEEAIAGMVGIKGKLVLMVLAVGLAVGGAGWASHVGLAEKTEPVVHAQARAPAAKNQAGVSVKKDLYDDPLPPGVLARLGTLRLRHGGVVGQAVFSPDSKTVMAASQAGIYVWDVATGREKRRYPGWSWALALSPDEKALATQGGGGGVCLLDATTGKTVRQFQQPDGFDMLAFSPDGKSLASWHFPTSDDRAIGIWDVTTATQRCLVTTKDISCVAFSPDSNTLASSSWSDPEIHLWDPATGKEVRRFAADKHEVTALAYSPDGKILASTRRDNTLCFWDVASGRELRRAHDPGALFPFLLAFAPDGKTVASYHYEHGIGLWDTATAKLVRRFEGHIPLAGLHTRQLIGSLSFSPDGKVLASRVNEISAFELWDVSTGQKLHSLNGHQGAIDALAFSPDGHVLASASGNPGVKEGVRQWDTHTSKEQHRYGDHFGVRALAFSPDGKTLASGSHGAILLFDRDTSKQVGKLEGHESYTTSLAFAGDGKTLASLARDKTLRVWDVALGKQRARLEMTDDWWSHHLALAPDGRTVAVGEWENSIGLWDIASGKVVRRFQGPQGVDQRHATPVAFSPDGKMLASGSSDQTVRLWEVSTGKELRIFQKAGPFINFVAFSPDGRTLASGGADNTVCMWELLSGQERRRFTGHQGSIHVGTFSRDGKRLATGSADTTVLVWDVLDPGGLTGPVSRQQLENLWMELASDDAVKAYRALSTFVRIPEQAVPFLQERLRPIPVLDARQQKQVTHWLNDLDSTIFSVRQHATQELMNLGESTTARVREALTTKNTLEVRQRLELLLEKMKGPPHWRVVRAIEALEHMAGPRAQVLLTQLSSGAPGASLTQEALAATQRRSKDTSEK